MSLPTDTKRKIFDGRYEIISIVGRGADSVVYHARHITGPATEVAIKVLVNRGGTSTLSDKLRKEALTLVSCRHKYVVRLDDFHSIKDLCYLSMEFAPLGDLSRYITSTGKKLSAEQTSTYLRQALEALDFIHATGVIHRDLKPENILVVSETQIRLADFGLALLPGDEPSVEELRTAVGTFDYLAPEVLDGIRYDAQSDLYSLGVCFYEAATGSHPFHNAPLAEQRSIRENDRIKPVRELAPELPENVAAVITTLMRFSAHERFSGAADALKALQNPDFRELPPRAFTALQASDPVAATQRAPAASLTGNTAVAVDPPFSSAPTSVLEVQKPANIDAVAQRQPQPTEKIDLERVKAIIAKDSQRKSQHSESSSRDVSSMATEPPPPTALTSERSTARKAETIQGESRPSSGSLLSSCWGFLHSLPTVIRSVAVALISAVLTVGALLAWHTFSGNRAPSKTVTVVSDTKTQQKVEQPAPPVEKVPVQDVGPLTQLPAGVYTGWLQGILSGRNLPLALIAQPEQGEIILAVGLEGWVPSPAIASGDEGQENTLTFRSNGLILRFNRELSSPELTGTVTDVVTGETGTWKVAKSS